MHSPKVKRAIISVSDKLGLADFARGLAAAGVEIFSTGGTRKHLESEGIAVRDIADYTGFPEMMDGRLKTLHPKVHGGILCRHDNPEDMKALAEHGILTFELVVVNLYPFEATVARPGVTFEEAIEQIDIGGPTMVRAAAKNHAFTTIATDAPQYSAILEQIAAHGCTTLELRRRLAAEAFAHTAGYDRADCRLFRRRVRRRAVPGDAAHESEAANAVLRYGENPHQQAAALQPARLPPAPTSSPPSNSTARSFPTTICSISTARWTIVRTISPIRPPWSSSTTILAARPWPTRWPTPCERALAGDPAERVRLGAGDESAGRCRRGRGALRAGLVRRGHRRPRLPPRGPGNPHHRAQVEGQRAADEGRRAGAGPRRTGPIAASTAAC